MAVGVLTKIALAVDNSDSFRRRVGIACRYFGKQMTDHLLIDAALAMHEAITVSEDGVIDVEGIPDDAIIGFVDAYNPADAPDSPVQS